jgi:tungstate transport system substrate-binding protein
MCHFGVNRQRRWILVFAALMATLSPSNCAAQDVAASRKAANPPTVRCAIVGGLNESDFWPQLIDRFHRATGHHAEIVATGPKHGVAEAFKAKEADLIVMHSSDTMINLVADGFGENPQPWARNDYLIVGPPSDPAKIKGETDAVRALEKVITSKCKLLLHASSGVGEVLSDLLAAGNLELDPQSTISQPGERHGQMLQRAAAEQAYTLVGRIPFLNGKLNRGELQVMVQGDSRLRRAYLVVVASGKADDPRLIAARRLAAFLREKSTQEWIGGFGKGKFDDRPLFFSIHASGAVPNP